MVWWRWYRGEWGGGGVEKEWKRADKEHGKRGEVETPSNLPCALRAAGANASGRGRGFLRQEGSGGWVGGWVNMVVGWWLGR